MLTKPSPLLSLTAVRRALWLGVFVLLSGCASTIVVTGDVPTPLIKQAPLKGALDFSDDFRRYNYEEKEKGRSSLKNIAFGAAQVAMFDRVFKRILQVVPADEQELTEIDLRIAPQLLEFQYSVPRETKLNLYEIWLKYRVQITDTQGVEVADWVVKGYGKTPTSTLSSASKAFNAATNIALRDVGAQLAIGFPRQPAISQMLNARGVSRELENEPANNEPAESSSASSQSTTTSEVD